MSVEIIKNYIKNDDKIFIYLRSLNMHIRFLDGKDGSGIFAQSMVILQRHIIIDNSDDVMVHMSVYNLAESIFGAPLDYNNYKYNALFRYNGCLSYCHIKYNYNIIITELYKFLKSLIGRDATMIIYNMVI